MPSIETTYVGIGGAGGYIIKSQDRFFNDKRYLYLDKAPDLQSGNDELAGVDRTVYNDQNLHLYFSRENRYVLFLGLGGKTGSYIIIEILDYLHSKNIEHQCYCFYPYYFEVRSRIVIADETLVSLERYQDVTILCMDEMKKQFQNLSLASPFWIPNDILIEEYLKVD